MYEIVEFVHGPYDGYTANVDGRENTIFVKMGQRSFQIVSDRELTVPMRVGVYRRDPLNRFYFNWEGE